MVLKFGLSLAFALTLSTGAIGEALRVDGKPLEQAIDLPKGSASESLQLTGSIYLGNFPSDAADFDVRAAYGRLDRGEIGAYLAALISEKPVTGTATYKQTLLLFRMAQNGGGHTGQKAEKIKAIRQDVIDYIKIWACPIKCS